MGHFETQDGSFWDSRCLKNGHTGWGNRLIHAYDQPLRLKVFGQLFARLNVPHFAALDFGCGVGDFTHLLGRSFVHVVGYDTSASAIQVALRQNASTGITYVNSTDRLFTRSYDCVLAITVFQHITDNQELVATLKEISTSLSPGGACIVMDAYFRRSKRDEYTYIRRYEEFLQLAEMSGLKRIESANFYHPSRRPTLRFIVYYLACRLECMSEKLRERLIRGDRGLVNGLSPVKITIFGRTGTGLPPPGAFASPVGIFEKIRRWVYSSAALRIRTHRLSSSFASSPKTSAVSYTTTSPPTGFSDA